jgi:hypothetical protein
MHASIMSYLHHRVALATQLTLVNITSQEKGRVVEFINY